MIVAAYYRHTRELPWLVFLPWYSLLVRLFMLDALLSFRTRPVLQRRHRQAEAAQSHPTRGTVPEYLPAVVPEGALYSPPASTA